ncbi:hypothetical protein ACVWY3_004678 [Bradyrhizobium sp. USDA 4486]
MGLYAPASIIVVSSAIYTHSRNVSRFDSQRF